MIGFHFTDVEKRSRDWWIVVAGGDVDLCDFDPGYAVPVRSVSTLRAMVEIWRGDLSWRAALKDGALKLDGSQQARRALPHWLKLSSFAHTPRVVAS